ncbi:MAG TPA: hypothetical protein VEI57_08465 [Nitrospirota bacterium]|nr:hypothetical protein [Nitrospirota bacterium]
MKALAKKSKVRRKRETLTEAYEVRAFRDEEQESPPVEVELPEILHAEQGTFQLIKSKISGHGEQTVLPDDCQFGDNDLCDVES